VAKKKKKTVEISLAGLKRERDKLGKQIDKLEGKRWDIAWEIAQRECPVDIGYVLYRPLFDQRYVVMRIDSLTLAASHPNSEKVVTWFLRVAVINKDGRRRKRSRTQMIDPLDFEDNYVVVEDSSA
jgi:hypothetical protein